MRPTVVVKETSVPFCTGVPAPALVVLVGAVGVPFVGVPLAGGVEVTPFSITVATISISPFSGTLGAEGKSVMTEPVGARSGTLSHAAVNESTASAATAAAETRVRCVTISDAKDNTLMYLAGQDSERGYAMAALLVSIAVMTVMMSVAMPAWRHAAQREKEAELIFRGEQYARAINHYQRKMGPGTFPPTVDALVQGRFLRKKYKDPMTRDGEFQLIIGGAQPQGGNPSQPNPVQPGARGRGASGIRGAGPPVARGISISPGGLSPPPLGSPPGAAPGGGPFVGGQGAGGTGIMGVQSKSKEPSIRIYRGATRYNEWQFLFANVSNRPGGPGGAARPGGPGGVGRPGTGGAGGRGALPGGRGPGGFPGIGRPGGEGPRGRGPGGN